MTAVISHHQTDITITDMFCGAGGTSTGAVQAGATVTQAMNHWNRAIATHAENHRSTAHYVADIHETHPRQYRRTTMLCASPSCTNHSLAKGARRRNVGQPDLFSLNTPDPEEERSRCTMYDPLIYAEYHNYEYVILENVVDVRQWAPYNSWCQMWRDIGYETKTVYLNSMYFWPTPQSRDRWYFIAWKKGNRAPQLDFTPLSWCAKCATNVNAVQSWKKPGQVGGRYGIKTGQYVYRCPTCADIVQPYYYAAFNAIDWSIPTQKIGDRKHPLKANTLRRVQRGLDRFAADPFTLQVNKTTDRVRDMRDPLPTQTQDNGQGLVVPPYIINLSHGSSQGYVYGVDEPFPTQTTRDDLGMVMPAFMVENHNTSTARSILSPLGAVLAGGEHHSLVTMPFIIPNYGTDEGHMPKGHAVTEAVGAITANDNHALVMPHAMLIQNGHGSGTDCRLRELTDPIPTVTGYNNMYSLLTEHYLASYYGTAEKPHGMAEAIPALSTHDRHALVCRQPSIDECGFRMLEPHEIQAAMAFPSDYIVTGNRREKVKQLGNAVTSPVAKWLVERCMEALNG